VTDSDKAYSFDRGPHDPHKHGDADGLGAARGILATVVIYLVIGAIAVIAYFALHLAP
jgi:hypothetical protein